jgi:TolA-binding protein
MKGLMQKLLIVGLTVPLGTAQGLFAADDVSLGLKETISGLLQTQQNIQALGKLSREEGLGHQNIVAEQSFARAAEAFAKGQWLTVIQQTSSFLTLTQQPVPDAWMKAQYMLGRGYEERGQPGRAARAYLRYLSTFVTSKQSNYSELTDVIERLVMVGTRGSGHAKAELKQFLSSVAAMRVPEEVAPELRYFTAIGGVNIGQRNLALSWLGDLDRKESTPTDTKARSYLFKALLAMQDGRWEKAEDELQSVLSLGQIKTETRDRARLALGRVYLKMGKPQTAMKIYNSIPKESDSYKDATYERFFGLIRLKEYGSAKTVGQSFIENYEESSEAVQVRTLMSWLDLHRGDLKAAGQSIAEVQNDLEQKSAKVSEMLSGKTALTHEDVQALTMLAQNDVPLPSELQDILAMFEQIADMNERLADVEGVTLNLLYTMARVNLDEYSPQLALRIEQMRHVIKGQMDLAQKLISLESKRLSGTLSSIDRQRLKHTVQLRENLESKETKLAMESKRLLTWLEPAEMLLKLAKQWERNEKSINGAAKKNPGDVELDALEQAMALRSKMKESLTAIRRYQAQNLVGQSRLKEVRFIYEQFETTVIDDQAVISTYEPNQTQTLDILDDDDSQKAWSIYMTNTKLIVQSMMQLEQDAESFLKRNIADIDRLLERKKKLFADVKDLTDVLQSKGASAAPAMLAHFDYAFGQRIAKQQKWSADIDFIKYTQATDDHKTLKRKQELELQVLSDNLREKDTGVSQWPR